MAESADKIREHIRVLSEFEVEYREFIGALEAFRRDGTERWSEAEYSRRRRKLQMESVRADRAIKASGVGGLVFTEAPAAGGGVRSTDLPSQIFDFIETGSGFEYDDGLDFQRALLDRMPSQIAGLQMMLEDGAGAAPQEAAVPDEPKGTEKGRWAWLNHPWTVAIGSGIFLLILGLILSRVL